MDIKLTVEMEGSKPIEVTYEYGLHVPKYHHIADVLNKGLSYLIQEIYKQMLIKQIEKEQKK